MAAKQQMKTAKVFKLGDYQGAGSGGFFVPGLYRIEESRFTMFDYNGKVPGGLPVHTVKFQPLNRSGKPEGDPSVQHFNIRVAAPGLDTEEWQKLSALVKPSKDGKTLEIPEECVLSQKCDHYVFVKSLGDHGFDLDSIEEDGDVSALDGLEAEFGLVESTRPPKEDGPKGKDGKPLPNRTVAVTSIPANTKPAGGKTNGKAAEGKAGGKKAAAFDPESVLQDYLLEHVLVDDNADGVDKIKVRMAIGSFVQKQGGDADAVKQVADLFNEAKYMEPLLDSAGWKIETVKGKQFLMRA